MTPALDHLALLESHQDRVRGLVRALLRDEHDADDVMQEAWVRALASRPRDPRAAGAWFARVARRLALNRLRSGARRERREHAAAREEALPSSAEVAARVELGQRVLSAVEALPANHRAVLRDRYLGELTPSELARRDGLAPETVKSRLSRARAALRRQLDGESFEGGWRHALVPFVAGAAPTATLMPTSLAASALGALAMKKALLAAALLSFVVVGAWFGRRELIPAERIGEPALAVGPGGSHGASAPSDVGDAPRASSADPAAASTRAAATANAAPRALPWRTTGRVALSTGAPPPGPVSVQLALYEGREPRGEPLERALVTTDAAGAFRWELPVPAGVVTATAWVAHEDYLSLSVEPQTAVPDDAPPDFAIQLVPRDATLEGTVRAPDGELIEGARVRWADFEALSAADGSYRLRVAGQWLYRITAEADGYGRGVASMNELAPGALARLDLDLTEELVVSGSVVDEQGIPRADAVVKISRHSDIVARTDELGRFLLRGLPRVPDGQVLLSARLPGFCEAAAYCDVPLEGELVRELVLSRGARVAGVVVGADGRPLAGAEAWVGASRHSFGTLAVVSDDAGRFEFEAVPVGRRRVTVEHADHAPVSVSFEVPAGAVQVSDLVVELRAGSSLSGIVRDPRGAPVEGVGVSAQVGREYVNSSDRTDSTGRFQLDGLPAGAVRVSTYALGWVRDEVLVPRDHVGELELVVRPAGRLGGRVVDGATGAPVTNFTIRIVDAVLEEGDEHIGGYSSVWSEHGKRFDDPDGRWDLGEEELEPGCVTGIEASAPGYAPAVEPRAVVAGPGEDALVVLTLRRPVELALQVRAQPRGDAVVGARVVASQEERPAEEDRRWSEITDSTGSCVLTDVAPGTLWIALERAGCLTMQLGRFEVRHDQAHQRIELAIPAGASLRGVVRDEAEGAGQPEVEVKLIALEVDGVPHLSLETTSDAQGGFGFDDLPPGLYQLARVLRRGEHETYELSLKVRIEADALLVVQDLVAPRGSAAIVGRIGGELELPPGVVVSLLEREGDLPPVRSTLMQDDGSFAFERLPPGSFLVTMVHIEAGTGRFLHAGRDVLLAEGERVELTLELEVLKR